MKNACLLFTILYLIVTNCSCQNRTSIKDNCIYDIPDTLYDFFPKRNFYSKNIFFTTNAEKTDLPFYPENFTITYLVEIYQYDDFEEKNIITTDLKKRVKYLTLSERTDYKIISSQDELYNIYDSVIVKKIFFESQTKNLVLNFRGILKENSTFLDSKTICGLPRGYTIDIINSGYTYLLPEKYKFEWVDLPLSIRHGYISGIAYNNSDLNIIYWVVAW